MLILTLPLLRTVAFFHTSSVSIATDSAKERVEVSDAAAATTAGCGRISARYCARQRGVLLTVGEEGGEAPIMEDAEDTGD